MNNINKTRFIKNNDIIIEPNTILKQVSGKVDIPLNKTDMYVLKMLYNHVSNSHNEEYANKHGIRPAVGIAAIQVGINKRLLAIKTKDNNDKVFKLALANPIYLYKSDEMCYLEPTEGCLSVQEDKYKGIVPRHYHIKVKAYNMFSNKEEIIDVKGYNAIVLQHEMDHLDGKLYIDKINKLDPNYIKDDWIKI